MDAFKAFFGLALITILIDLFGAPDTPTRSIKDALKAFFGLALYPLNRTTLVELGVNGGGAVVEDTTVVMSPGYRMRQEHDAFWRVNDVSVLVDLVVGGSGRARKNVTVMLLNLVKSNGDKAVGDITEVDGAKVTMRALANGDSKVST
ncbi:hypothetical protein C4D60_Mb05t20450 [Musa balbisiana]|uniref:Uncharacterized protein n=1 Tax=Musa balbisiana TaxID=52838 RepID=A0A4S8JXL4_MUSBA|nr:hypothetical protein C4D60_Mb05t20450 [Musa balbisiana]